jgi:hypothetical protein
MKATICDRCGKTVKDAEVGKLDLVLTRPGFTPTTVKDEDDRPAELCPACAEVVEKTIETRVMLKESNSGVILIGTPVKPEPVKRDGSKPEAPKAE